MKNKRIAVYLCTAIILAATGCGNSKTDTVAFDNVGKNATAVDADTPEGSSYQENDNTDDANATDTQKNDNFQENGNADNTDATAVTDMQENNNIDSVNTVNAQESNQTQEDMELDGSVESIGDNSIVINKTFNLSETTAVTNVGDEKVLITAYFSEETTYEVWTVKNGGVNGDSDTEKRQGAFTDIKEQSSVNMSGSYEGNDFHAKHVVIYQFV